VLFTLECASCLDELPQISAASQITRINEEYESFSLENRSINRWKADKQGFVASVVDGIKRVTRWLWGKVKGIFRKISDAVSKIIRVTKFLATQAFDYFSKFVSIMKSGLSVLTNPELIDSKTLRIVKDKDFDISVLCTESVSAEHVDKQTKLLLVKVAHFRIACLFLKLLIQGFTTVLAVLKGKAWKVVDAVLALANFGEKLSEDDKYYLDIAFNQT
jgi:hypothetical protein